MQIFKRYFQFLLCALLLALSVSAAKAQTDPCSRAYSIAASVMSARQYGVLLPEVLKKTNVFIEALDQRQRADVNNAVRGMIVSAYKLKLGVFPNDSAIEEFANSYALRCIEGKDDQFANIDWNERTVDAVANWTDSLESVKQTTKLEEAFERAEERIGWNALDQMTTRITQAWRRPVGFKGGLEVYLRMSLASNGELVDVRIVKTSGDVLFDRSAVTAVKRAAPFDEVKQFDEATFEEKFRSLTVKFRPED